MSGRSGTVLVAATAVLVLMGEPAAACRITSIDAVSGPPSTESITLVEATGERTIAIADIERLPLKRMEDCATFRTGSETFEGVFLADLLLWAGVAAAPSIEVTGLDRYSSIIPREDWTTWPIVLATRIDGRPLTRRERGPARILYPVDRDPKLSTREYQSRAVWLISEIAVDRAAD